MACGMAAGEEAKTLRIHGALRSSRTYGEVSDPIVGEGPPQVNWRDRNLRSHRYDLVQPSPHIEPLLAEIEGDPTSIFWG